MTVSSINDNKIRVTLSFEERFRLFGETEKLSLNDPSVRMALRILFKKIKYEYRFLHNCSRVYVDLYKGNSGGFVIYLTKQNQDETTEQTFVFPSADHLLDAIYSIKEFTQNYRVFSHSGKFYLQLDCPKLNPLVEEFLALPTTFCPIE